MQSLPKVKSGQIGVDSNITQNYTSSIYNIIYGHYLPQFTWKVDQNRNLVKLESVRTLLRITPLASRNACLLIICPISHEKLTKSEIRLSHYVPLFGFIYSYFAPIYHFGPDLALFIDIFPIFSFIYLYLPTFTLTWLYLPLIVIIWHICHISYLYILLVRPHICAKY